MQMLFDHTGLAADMIGKRKGANSRIIGVEELIISEALWFSYFLTYKLSLPSYV